jgi:hypothetical protein
MGRAVAQVLIKLLVGVTVAVVAFGSTTFVMHVLSPPRPQNPNLIHVTEATFGESCKNFAPAVGHANTVRSGNATLVASQTCDNTDAYCPVYVDAVRIGDPALGCGKDFIVRWRCGIDAAVQEIRLAPDATDKVAWLSCQTQKP